MPHRDPDTGKFVSTKKKQRRRRLTQARRILYDGEIDKGDGVSILFGALVGVFLAHHPQLVGPGATGVVAGGALYRALFRAFKTEVGGRVIEYLDTFLAAAVILFTVTFALHEGHLDVLFHFLGTHQH